MYAQTDMQNTMGRTNEWIVIDEIVEFLGSDQEWANDAPLVNDFFGICYTSFGDQINNTIGKHLRMNTKIFVIV